MSRRCIIAASTIGFLVISAPLVRADVRTDERALVKFEGMLGRIAGLFGGKAAREGVRTTIAVKGDRKVSMADQTGQIVDLKEEKIYDLDIRRKTYQVTTFAELRRQLEEARRKAEEDLKKVQAEAKAASQPPAASGPGSGESQMEVDFDLKETGQKKSLNGFDVRQIVMTITMREKGKTLEQSGGMVLTSDIWMTPSIPAMKEVADFDLRYAQALAGPMLAGASADQMAAAMAMYPMMRDAIARMRAENVKMDGAAILTTTTFDAVKSAEQMAAEQKQQQEQPQSADSGSPRGVGGLLGGLARRARGGSGNQPSSSPRTTVMTMTSEILKVATSVTDAEMAIPAGFRETK